MTKNRTKTAATRKPKSWTDRVWGAILRDDVPGTPGLFLLYCVALVRELPEDDLPKLHTALSAAVERMKGGAK